MGFLTMPKSIQYNNNNKPAAGAAEIESFNIIGINNKTIFNNKKYNSKQPRSWSK